MKFDMKHMRDKVEALSSKISVGKLYHLNEFDYLVEDFLEGATITIDDLFPKNAYGNFRCEIKLDNDSARYFVFLQPYGDYDIPDKFWKKVWYKEIVDHCCAVDNVGIVYVVYKFENCLSLDAVAVIKGDVLTKIMNGEINHKRPYRFTWGMDDIMAFIMKEYGYDDLRKTLDVKFNVV